MCPPNGAVLGPTAQPNMTSSVEPCLRHAWPRPGNLICRLHRAHTWTHSCCLRSLLSSKMAWSARWSKLHSPRNQPKVPSFRAFPACPKHSATGDRGVTRWWCPAELASAQVQPFLRILHVGVPAEPPLLGIHNLQTPYCTPPATYMPDASGGDKGAANTPIKPFLGWGPYPTIPPPAPAPVPSSLHSRPSYLPPKAALLKASYLYTLVVS